jgi:hypothetical protein
MAVYKSNLVTKKNRHRGMWEGQDYDVAGRIFLPAGTVLAAADDLLFVPVGENQAIKKVAILTLGATGAAEGSVGTFQILDKAGNPVVVERVGPAGDASTKFTSPATSAASLKATGNLDGFAETDIAAPAKLAGPTNVGIRITTGATLAGDVEMFVTVTFAGETSTKEVLAEYPNPYQYPLNP